MAVKCQECGKVFHGDWKAKVDSCSGLRYLELPCGHIQWTKLSATETDKCKHAQCANAYERKEENLRGFNTGA